MMNTVAPIWDGNETWLVLGGEGLLAAFPLAYSIILSGALPAADLHAGRPDLPRRGLRVPLQGQRARTAGLGTWPSSAARRWPPSSRAWRWALLQGIPVSGRSYAGGPFDWLAPFPLAAGAGVVIAYALLGATWLIMKHRGRSAKAHDPAWPGPCPAAAGGDRRRQHLDAAAYHQVAERWFSFPNVLLLSPVPLLVALCAVLLLRALGRAPYRTPFVAALGLVLLCYAGMAISIWPHIVPFDLTIWEAAAPPASQRFTLVGALVVIPLILAYTGWSYYVFRGKVGDEGYH
jgi:cytochrome d ubiquinol oxidase subunit II